MRWVGNSNTIILPIADFRWCRLGGILLAVYEPAPMYPAPWEEIEKPDHFVSGAGGTAARCCVALMSAAGH